MFFRTVVPALFLCAGLHAQVAIVNNASFRADQPVSPGSWVAAFGAFTGVPTTTASALPLPKTLGGVRVTVDGVEVPLYDVRATQITFLIPYATTPGQKDVAINTGGAPLNGNVRVLAAAPGLFIKDSTVTPPRGAVINVATGTENTSANPASRGQFISIYGTGPGALSRTPADGAAPGTPIANTTTTPQVYIGGVLAEVQFSGMNSEAPGLWQINAAIPNLPFISGRVPVLVFVDGVDSNEVTIFVAQ